MIGDDLFGTKKKLELYISLEYSPVINLSIEEYLFDKVSEDVMILFLWQNEKSVIVGRNQNPYFECNIDYVKNNHIAVVRRNTGGGAVYHDIGNLNYSIIQNGMSLSRETICNKILRALSAIGIIAKRDGRNDIVVDDKKISGMAFLNSESKFLYHGCIMVSTDIDEMTRCLNARAEKFLGKRIDSVKARVANLTDFCENVCIDDLKQAIIEEFKTDYPAIVKKNVNDVIQAKGFSEILSKYNDVDWNWGIRNQMSIEFGDHFEWGNIRLAIVVKRNKITDVMIDSDSLDVDTFQNLKEEIKGTEFSKKSIIRHISHTLGNKDILDSICAMIEKEQQIL